MPAPTQEMLDLLRWHGAEEVEHRSLVFDVYQKVSGSYFIRAFSMLLTLPDCFIGCWVRRSRAICCPMTSLLT